jgi:hypothetical protein
LRAAPRVKAVRTHPTSTWSESAGTRAPVPSASGRARPWPSCRIMWPPNSDELQQGALLSVRRPLARHRPSLVLYRASLLRGSLHLIRRCGDLSGCFSTPCRHTAERTLRQQRSGCCRSPGRDELTLTAINLTFRQAAGDTMNVSKGLDTGRKRCQLVGPPGTTGPCQVDRLDSTRCCHSPRGIGRREAVVRPDVSRKKANVSDERPEAEPIRISGNLAQADGEWRRFGQRRHALQMQQRPQRFRRER